MMPLVPSLPDAYRVVGFDQRGTGGSGLLRCRALEHDPRLRSVRAGEACARRLGEKRRLYTTPDSVEDLEAIRAELGVERLTLFGISYGTELALAYARAHPRPRRPADPRLRRRPRRPRPVRARGLPRDRAEPGRAVPARAAAASRATRSGSWPQLAARLRDAGAARRLLRPPRTPRTGTASGRPRSPTCCSTPTTTRRCGRRSRRRARRAARGLARRSRGWSPRATGLAELPSPKSFSSARYATVCEETPLPWDATTPFERAPRRGPAARGGARPGRVLPVRPHDRRGRRDRPLPALAGRAVGARARARGAVPGRADPAAAGRRGPAHAARGLGARGGGHPRRRSASRCRAWATPWSAATRAAAACGRSSASSPARPPAATAAGSGPACRARRCRRAAAQPGAAARAARPRGPDGGGDRRHRRRPRFSLSPAFLAYSGGGLRGGSFAVRRGRVFVRRFSAIRGMWISGVGPRRRAAPAGRRPGGRPRARDDALGRAGQRAPRRAGVPRAAAGLRPREPGARRVARPSRCLPRSRGAALARVLRAPLVAKSSRSRLVPSPVR